MYSPTTRLLTVLEILQSQGQVSGPELAERLEVDVRSVRRYVTMLRDMGIPVDSDPGRFGSYYLRAGFRLPPLMFNSPEILAIILGLMAVRRLGMSATAGAESAAAKIERVLPSELRERVRALQGVLTLNIPAYRATPEELVAQFSLAAHQENQMWIEYGGGGGDKTERVIDVYGLVYHAGFWYAAAFCHLRNGLRSFRLDRVLRARLLNSSFDRPTDFDPLDYLLTNIATAPGTWHVEVLLRTSLDAAKEMIPADMAVIEAVPHGVMMRCYSNNLDWMARFLAGLRCKITVYEPAALREELRKLAQTVLKMARAPVGRS
jgi:predicted DNA-binding transcriptional regulator YafY